MLTTLLNGSCLGTIVGSLLKACTAFLEEFRPRCTWGRGMIELMGSKFATVPRCLHGKPLRFSELTSTGHVTALAQGREVGRPHHQQLRPYEGPGNARHHNGSYRQFVDRSIVRTDRVPPGMCITALSVSFDRIHFLWTIKKDRQ